MNSRLLLIGLLAIGVADLLVLNLAVGPAYLASFESAQGPETAQTADPTPRPVSVPLPLSAVSASRGSEGEVVAKNEQPVPDSDRIPPATTTPTAQPAADTTADPAAKPPTRPDGPAAPRTPPVLFSRKSAELSKDARASLDRLGKYLRANRGVRVSIAGHADARGEPSFNDWLSRQRALAVERYLRSMGVSPGRMQVSAFGSRKPVDSSGTDAADASNRRVEVSLL